MDSRAINSQWNIREFHSVWGVVSLKVHRLSPAIGHESTLYVIMMQCHIVMNVLSIQCIHCIDYLVTSVSVCVSLCRDRLSNNSMRPQFFTDLYQILHAAGECDRFDAYCL